MTQEERLLLLKDLCARFPYGVIVRVHDIEHGDFDSYVDSISNTCIETRPVEELTNNFNPYVFYKLQEIKPYLRSMSSMTEEEEDEYWNIINLKSPEIPVGEIPSIETIAQCSTVVLDWLLSKGFDVRCLIPMGLALEAKEGMYKNE